MRAFVSVTSSASGSVAYRAIIGEVCLAVHLKIHLRIGIMYRLVNRCMQSLHHFDGSDLLYLVYHSIHFASFYCIARKHIRSIAVRGIFHPCHPAVC